MTEENKALAYELWLQHWSYARIAAHLEARQGDVIRIVAAAQRRQDTLCARCRWRRDGVSVCLLPRCMHELGRQKRKRRERVWKWRKSGKPCVA